ncbi:hypothetical protein MKW94_018838 [Papaver nudicaule]|uniref:Guanine nucleotide-binding protein subunit beta-like protein n=1 Tax=Papaver nudicaule TaxID=74823 RepID=A0AA41S9V5_PAPNU|nr:hypothetical protein [Papaver nudicaule]
MAETLILRGTLVGHYDMVTAIACPMDNSDMIVSSSRDKSILVWTLNKQEGNYGVPKRRLTGHGHIVHDVVLSSDAQYALSGSCNGDLRLWDLSTGVTTRRFVGHTEDVISVAFSSDNRRIVSASRDRSIKLWDTFGECTYSIQDGDSHTDWVSCDIWLSPDTLQAIVVSASSDKTVKVWDGDDSYTDLMSRNFWLSPNTLRETVVSDSWYKTVQGWNLTDRTLRNPLAGHGGHVNTVAVSPDGTLCVTGGENGVALLWDLAKGERTYSLDLGGGTIHALCFSPNRYWLCVATEKEGVRIWDLENMGVVHDLKFEPDLNWSSDGSTLFTGYTDGAIRVWGFSPSKV